MLAAIAASLSLVFVACATQQRESPEKRQLPNPHFASPTGEYGYTETNPILVASLGAPTKPANERAFLDRLRGPGGQRVSYRRRGSCGELFPTPNSGLPGVLDCYEAHYVGLAEPVVLYLNMYDPGEARAPAGFILLE